MPMDAVIHRHSLSAAGELNRLHPPYRLQLSNTLEATFCVQAWHLALACGNKPPLIANTDQGAQFTSADYVGAVAVAGVQVSMDGRGRWMDNQFIERL